MADNEKVPEGTASRGADWEVVSLTASTYAAAPGPGGSEKPPESKDEPMTSSALLASDQFVFPPSEHENLPIETKFGDDTEGGLDSNTVIQGGLDTDVAADGIQYFDQVKNLSAQDMEVQEEEDIDDGDVIDDDDDNEDDDDGDEDGDEVGAKYIELENEVPTNFPHILWWKRHATRYYLQAKDSNTFWPVVVAAALVGLAVLGHKLHQNKWQLRQLKWH